MYEDIIYRAYPIIGKIITATKINIIKIQDAIIKMHYGTLNWHCTK